MHRMTVKRVQQRLALITVVLATAMVVTGCVRQESTPTATPRGAVQMITSEVAPQETNSQTSSTRVTIVPMQPTTTALPTATLPLTQTELPQEITIESPPPGTVVGSPVVLTGRTSRFPLEGKLNYMFFDTSGTRIGAGAFDVNGTAGQPATFNVSLAFNLPAPGPIRAELYERNAAGVTISKASIDLYIAPPQAITIETPSTGSLVGSPVILTGRLARYPFEGVLGYRVLDTTGQQLGADSFPVSGTPGQPTTFNGAVTFDGLMDGGTIRVELFDQNPNDGVVAASSSIDLLVAPIQQAIVIGTPEPGTMVGSPVVITGQTARYPFDGKLVYRIVAANGAILGNGAFNVVGTPGQSTTFDASINFTLPRGGGLIRVELFDQNAATGVIVASTSVDLLYYAP